MTLYRLVFVFVFFLSGILLSLPALGGKLLLILYDPDVRCPSPGKLSILHVPRPHAWTALLFPVCSHSWRQCPGFLVATGLVTANNHPLIAARTPPNSHPLTRSNVHSQGPGPWKGTLERPLHRYRPASSQEALSSDSGPVSLWMHEPATGQALQGGATQERRSDMNFLLIRN